MLMLHCLVFAAAGPWMPGDGDVSPMDPTIAYGAAPNMLVFAPDGGAGFDLGGQDSFVEFLTSWNTTIAGPLGTSGAQNVIPPIHSQGPNQWPSERRRGVGTEAFLIIAYSISATTQPLEHAPRRR